MLGSEVVLNPPALLVMWAAGILGAGAVIAHWRIVGPGFVWMTVGTAGLIGGGAWLFDPDLFLGGALLVGISASLAARRPEMVRLLLGLSAATLVLVAAQGNPALPVVTGSLALGGITSEMLLGHWYLINPRIPRRPLQHLAAAGAVGVALDAAMVLPPGFPLAGSLVLPVVALALAGASCLLMVAVWFALRYPSYPGVMAATGLSYLAILTCLGSVSLVRVVAEGTAALR